MLCAEQYSEQGLSAAGTLHTKAPILCLAGWRQIPAAPQSLLWSLRRPRSPHRINARIRAPTMPLVLQASPNPSEQSHWLHWYCCHVKALQCAILAVRLLLHWPEYSDFTELSNKPKSPYPVLADWNPCLCPHADLPRLAHLIPCILQKTLLLSVLSKQMNLLNSLKDIFFHCWILKLCDNTPDPKPTAIKGRLCIQFNGLLVRLSLGNQM